MSVELVLLSRDPSEADLSVHPYLCLGLPGRSTLSSSLLSKRKLDLSVALILLPSFHLKPDGEAFRKLLRHFAAVWSPSPSRSRDPLHHRVLSGSPLGYRFPTNQWFERDVSS